MTNYMGGSVEACDHREYGHAMLTVTKHPNNPSMDKLFADLEGNVQVQIDNDAIPTLFFVMIGAEMQTF
jgi:GMP synthase-like glutamine amidotransferase